jgi:hypothetical protein
VRLVAKPRVYLANGPVRAGFTSRLGKARFTYRLKATSVAGLRARHLTVATRAKTPTATASKQASLRLPTSLDF